MRFEDGPDLTLIDTLYELDGRLILAAIQRLGRSISDLKRIAITHAHRSHLGGVATLKRLSGATVISHEWKPGIVSGDRKAQQVTIAPRLPVRAYFPFQVRRAERESVSGPRRSAGYLRTSRPFTHLKPHRG
jgi:glyoxylase-like metal-dependent hydrolase (beta-lactamase superfamily II)